ncbi:NACHT domain-containing protein [Agrobacterium pusense]|uniref:NACHT domain-containing protein n=1 Tax=Agrobacterium pusense TaxID=648995 RepID=UPI003FD4F5DE
MPLIDIAALLTDLSPFADLGTEPPVIVPYDGKHIVRMSREGYPLELVIFPDGAITEKHDGHERRHASFKALLASPTFADLARWADSQRMSLRDRVESETIAVTGRFARTAAEGNVAFFNETLWSGQPANGTGQIAVTLIDGPAGIGKTSFIRGLAFDRASSYQTERRPLVLHVESRGRMLQNLTDLMAFSLQTLRLKITYDQVPPLVRHGLILLAIDGFDELGDPNGYGLAWAQVNELITSSRGNGSLILSGRETFVSLDRLRPVLTSLTENDDVNTFTLQPLSASDARKWLRLKGWSEVTLSCDAAAPLFEPNSYALRPFFLSELARTGVEEQITQGAITNLLSFLVEAMAVREATKFGKDVEQVTSADERKHFVENLMEEIARDLAENQTEAIAAETVAWLAEICSQGIVPDALSGILKNRAGVIAFLTEDVRRGYRRFVHEQVSHYFLSRNIKRAVSEGEVPKYLRRNIFGLEFLESFSEYCLEWSSSDAKLFMEKVAIKLDEVGDFDRSRRNLASLLLTVSCIHQPSSEIVLKNISIDEVYLLQEAGKIVLKSVSINQLYARETDLRSLAFDDNCYIVSLVADDGTIPSRSMPFPSFISLHEKTLINQIDKSVWLTGQYEVNPFEEWTQQFFDTVVTQLPLVELLSKVARTKSYWIKDDEEDRAVRRILDDSHWVILKEIMIKHDLLTIRVVPASGRPGTFYHVKKRQALVDLRKPADDVVPFFRELLKVSAQLLKISKNAK